MKIIETVQQRVKLSPEGVRSDLVKGGADARGWTIPYSGRGKRVYPGCLRVQWDHCRYARTIHQDFIEVIP
jgi:hypothetical protein